MPGGEYMPPPREIPRHLLDDYTMGGIIQIESLYKDDSKLRSPPVYERETVNTLVEDAARRKTRTYPFTDTCLYAALDTYPVRNADVAVMGSRTPWYEAICIHYGGRPHVIDYHRIISRHPAIQTYTPGECARSRLQCDAAFSISSFEHDGLGRYGDPLDPHADIAAMRTMKRILKPGGLLYLSVPVGTDKLVWNAHRIYGRTRLPLLLSEWEIVATFGFDSWSYGEDTGKYAQNQPLFVLRNTTHPGGAAAAYLEGIRPDTALLKRIFFRRMKRIIGRS